MMMSRGHRYEGAEKIPSRCKTFAIQNAGYHALFRAVIFKIQKDAGIN
jgi:hypothetical protein